VAAPACDEAQLPPVPKPDAGHTAAADASGLPPEYVNMPALEEPADIPRFNPAKRRTPEQKAKHIDMIKAGKDFVALELMPDVRVASQRVADEVVLEPAGGLKSKGGAWGVDEFHGFGWELGGELVFPLEQEQNFDGDKVSMKGSMKVVVKSIAKAGFGWGFDVHTPFPDFWNTSINYVEAYLKGLFHSEASVTISNKVKIDTVAEKLAKKLDELGLANPLELAVGKWTIAEGGPFSGPKLGPIPTTFYIVLGAQCQLKVSSNIELEASIGVKGEAKFGFKYSSADGFEFPTHTGWDQWKKFDYGQGRATAQLTCMVGPRIYWKIADLVGPWIDAKVGQRGTLDFKSSCPAANTIPKSQMSPASLRFAFEYGVKLVVGGSVHIAIKGIGTLFEKEFASSTILEKWWMLFEKTLDVGPGPYFCNSLCEDKKRSIWKKGLKPWDHNGESDVDCGGEVCAPCKVGKKCGGNWDCEEGFLCFHDKCSTSTRTIPATTTSTTRASGTSIAARSATRSARSARSARPMTAASPACASTASARPSTATTAFGTKPNETDVDCGGPCKNKCVPGELCAKDSDCTPGFVCGHFAGKKFCMSKGCKGHSNGKKDGLESDIDCGGACWGIPTPPGLCKGAVCGSEAFRCAIGDSCNKDNDCVKLNCLPSGKCGPEKCLDNILDGKETDVDCGGPECRKRCAYKKKCGWDGDCRQVGSPQSALFCVNWDGKKHHNTGKTCKRFWENGKFDYKLEPSLDCGGKGSPNKCKHFDICWTNNDCGTGLTCKQTAFKIKRCLHEGTCYDKKLTGDEADIDCGTDCGGGCKFKCGPDKKCKASGDCYSGVCSKAGKCLPPLCENGKLDAGEADVDCGGSCKAQCHDGKACKLATDCKAGMCLLKGGKTVCGFAPCLDKKRCHPGTGCLHVARPDGSTCGALGVCTKGACGCLPGDLKVAGKCVACGCDVAGTVSAFAGSAKVTTALVTPPGTWTSDFGVAVGASRGRVIVGGRYSRAAHIFEQQPGGTWQPGATLTRESKDGCASGKAVAIADDLAAVRELDCTRSISNKSYWVPPRLRMYRRIDAAAAGKAARWIEDGVLAPFGPMPTAMGHKPKVADQLAMDGTTLVMQATDRRSEAVDTASQVLVYVRGAGGWGEQARLASDTASSPASFGAALALDGDDLVVANPNRRDLSIYRRKGQAWTREQQISRYADYDTYMYGKAVALRGNLLAVLDQPRSSVFAKRGMGVQLYRRSVAGSWHEHARVKATEGVPTGWSDAVNLFGVSRIGISGDAVVWSTRETVSGSTLKYEGRVRIFRAVAGTWKKAATWKNPDSGVMHGFAAQVVAADGCVSRPKHCDDGDPCTIGACTKGKGCTTTKTAFNGLCGGGAGKCQGDKCVCGPGTRLVDDGCVDCACSEQGAGATWAQAATVAQFTGNPPYYTNSTGAAVGISGKYGVIGTPGARHGGGSTGTVTIIEQDAAGGWQKVGEVWPHHGKPFQGYGNALAISGDRFVVGDPDDKTRSTKGALDVYERGGKGWHLAARLYASDSSGTGQHDYQFGRRRGGGQEAARRWRAGRQRLGPQRRQGDADGERGVRVGLPPHTCRQVGVGGAPDPADGRRGSPVRQVRRCPRRRDRGGRRPVRDPQEVRADGAVPPPRRQVGRRRAAHRHRRHVPLARGPAGAPRRSPAGRLAVTGLDRGGHALRHRRHTEAHRQAAPIGRGVRRQRRRLLRVRRRPRPGRRAQPEDEEQHRLDHDGGRRGLPVGPTRQLRHQGSVRLQAGLGRAALRRQGGRVQGRRAQVRGRQ